MDCVTVVCIRRVLVLCKFAETHEIVIVLHEEAFAELGQAHAIHFGETLLTIKSYFGL